MQCNAFGEEKMTKPLPNIGNDTSVFLGDHMYFVKNFSSREELESDMIDVVVFEKTFAGLSSKEIGRTSLNLSAVYFEARHTVEHRWLILQNKREDFQNVKGYIRLSVNLATITDKKVELKPADTAPQGSSFFGEVEIPPSVSLKTHQLKIRVIRGRDFDASAKPWLEFTLGPTALKTSAKSGQAALWNEKLFLALVSPSFISTIAVKALDPKQAGSAQLDLKAVSAGHFKALRWVNFYGPPAGASSKSGIEFMERNPSKGRPRSGSFCVQRRGSGVSGSADRIQDA